MLTSSAKQALGAKFGFKVVGQPEVYMTKFAPPVQVP